MPGIKLNFEFDVDSFEATVDHNSFLQSHPNHPGPIKAHIQERLQFCLESFRTKIKGNTSIGGLRCSLYEAIHRANPQLFSGCKGVDLWFNGLLLNSDSQIIIDIVGLWNGSTIVVTPTKSVLEFVDAFLNYSHDLANNRKCMHSLIWNALNEAVKQQNLQIWEMFVAAMMQYWNQNKLTFNEGAKIFVHYLVDFDPEPLRLYCGAWKLLNVIMGTPFSVPILRRLLIDEDFLFEFDGDGRNAMMFCVLQNDDKALDYILEFGLDIYRNIDAINTVYDYAMIFGPVALSMKLEEYKSKRYEKAQVIRTHPKWMESAVPTDIVNEIGAFLLGEDVMYHREDSDEDDSQNEEKQEEEKEFNLDALLEEFQQSIFLAQPRSHDLGSVDREESSTNDLHELDGHNRLSVISCSSH